MLLRKVAAFIRLSFSDPASKAVLCEKTDQAELSRSVTSAVWSTSA